MENLRERLARRMRELMDADYNLNTQTKVANKSGVSQSTVQRVLTQQQAATLDLLEELGRAFKVHRPEFLLLEATESALLKEWARLTPTDREVVLSYIRVVEQTRQSQLSIDVGRPVNAKLQASQKASAGRPAPLEAPLNNAAKRSKGSPPKRRKA